MVGEVEEGFGIYVPDPGGFGRRGGWCGVWVGWWLVDGWRLEVL